MEISHITLIVQNLAKTTTMLETLFEAEEIYDSRGQSHSYFPEKFFLIDGLWLAVMEDASQKLPKTYNHIAFKIDQAQIDSLITRIQGLGLKIEKDRSRIKGEGASIYFYDDDNHLFELHTGTLAERLHHYRLTETR